MLLNEIVENYFSMYLSDIRGAGGDINETAGDGLMIIFQDASPGGTQPQPSRPRCPSGTRRQREISRRRANILLWWLTWSIVGRVRCRLDQVPRHDGRALDLHRFWS